ncbi:cytochrome P450 2D14-like [Sceloporus undulatus]|uniref:cytochrome P450 2D14-like n=1 Tax=Sceloporus undulatus TaxID=8520 RepID=UPI001C4B9F2F|nr:cytochrome P450 2D14-like [Sceloporus undulatus]
MKMFNPVTGISVSISWLWTQFSSCWNNLTALTISLILFALLLDYLKRGKRCSRSPPGPAPLPFIGNLLIIDRKNCLVFDIKNPYKTLLDVAKQFGPTFSFQIGWKNYAVIGGFKMIKEALGRKSENFIEKRPIPLLKLVGRVKNCEGIFLATSSEGWKEQRKFCITTLKKFGMGKKTLEQRVSEEAGYLCSEFKSQEGSPFDPQKLISQAVGNVICILVFGDRFEYNDETFQKLLHSSKEIIKEASRILPLLLGAGSWLSYLPGPHRKILKFYNDFCVVVRKIINEHKKTRDPTFPRDVTDAFLEEIEKAKWNPESTFSEQNLFNVIVDLFGAGIETTTCTLLWGLLFMVLHPEVQKRVHREIDMVIGKVKPPMMEDQPKMPYTRAVIQEIQRYADVVPVTLPNVTHRDTEVGEFVIPKATAVFIHLSTMMKDETMWEKPHEFYPEHFLDENGQLVNREAFVPFSIGRHSCPGEQLAKMELFIFFTTLLQHFTFYIPENSPRPTEEKVFSLISIPLPFQICATPR